MRQRTGAPGQDEGPSTGAALLAGVALGLASDAVVLALPRQQARRLSGAGLAATGGVYLGFAVADGRRSALLVQAGEVLGFTALAALAVQRDSPGLLGAGWLAHTAWDALHYRSRGPTPGADLAPGVLRRLRHGPRRAAAHRPALAGTWAFSDRCAYRTAGPSSVTKRAKEPPAITAAQGGAAIGARVHDRSGQEGHRIKVRRELPGSDRR